MATKMLGSPLKVMLVTPVVPLRPATLSCLIGSFTLEKVTEGAHFCTYFLVHFCSHFRVYTVIINLSYISFLIGLKISYKLVPKLSLSDKN